jgi:hypothetical protein
LTIRTADGESRRFVDVAEPYQLQDMAATDPAMRRLMGEDIASIHRFFWLQRSRGCSKTTDAAIIGSAPIAFSPVTIQGLLCSGDVEQAQLTLEATRMLVRENPWVKPLLTVQKNCVLNPATGSTLRVVSSDAATSWGHLVDFVIMDEQTSWPDVTRPFFESIISALDKKPHSVLISICNAGFDEHFSRPIYDDARTSSDWYCHVLPVSEAKRITPEVLERQRRLLLPTTFTRVWLNQWVSGNAGGLPAEWLRSAVKSDLSPMLAAQSGWAFVAGVDLSSCQDRTALVVLARNGATNRVRLAHAESWSPAPGGEIDLESVEAAVLDIWRRYRPSVIAFDAAESRLMVQRLYRQGVPAVKYDPVPKNLTTMVDVTFQMFRDGLIDLFPNAELMADLCKLTILDRGNVRKFESKRDSSGHADTAFAFAIAAAQIDQMADGSGLPWTPIDVNAMPGLPWHIKPDPVIPHGMLPRAGLPYLNVRSS